MNFLEIIGLLTLIVLGVGTTFFLAVALVVFLKIRAMKKKWAQAVAHVQRTRQPADRHGSGGSDHREADGNIVEGEVVRNEPRHWPLDHEARKLPPIDQAAAMNELRSRGIALEDVALIRPQDNAVDLFDAVCGLIPENEHEELADLLHHGDRPGGQPYHLFVAWNEARPDLIRLRQVETLSNCEAWGR